MALRPCSSAERVLGIYELLDNIFYHVYCSSEEDDDDNFSIYFCENVDLLFVNKLWFSVGVEYVWRHVGDPLGPWRSDLEILVDDPERLQIYARCIESLQIKNDRMLVEGQPQLSRSAEVELDLSRFERILPGVEFPRLRTIKFTGGKPVGSLNSLSQMYLRDTVKKLWLCSLTPPVGFWSMLNVGNVRILFYLALSSFHLQLLCFYTKVGRIPSLRGSQALCLKARTSQSPLYCL